MFTASVDLSLFREKWADTVDEIRDVMSDAVQHAAEEGAAEAKRVGPFKDRTTNLRTGIVARFVAANGQGVQWEVFSPMFYSKWVNEGTSRSRPYPFMPPASEKAEQVLHSDLQSGLPARLRYVWPA